MSHFLDRLRFFKRIEGKFSNGHGITTSEDRQWEDAYRNRWRFDKVVRSSPRVQLHRRLLLEHPRQERLVSSRCRRPTTRVPAPICPIMNRGAASAARVSWVSV